jgi:hypothetical protein
LICLLFSSIIRVRGKAICLKLILVKIGFFGETLLSIIIVHFVLVVIDVLLARIVLTPKESGIYTVGMLVAKIAFFMPQAITVELFPKMGQNNSSVLLFDVLGTTLIGSAYVGFCYFASEFVVSAIGGQGYS